MQNEMNEKSFNDGLHADALTHEVTFEDPLTLACGLILPTHKLVFETYGTLNEERNNAILICHALSGNQHAAGLNTEGRPGWWDHYIGPDKPIDTNKFFVVCPNNIGSCFGSCLLYTSPSPRDVE